jgi:hydroxyacylglutathione hydrolase
MGGYDPVSPDITISERFGLEEFGIDGYILPSPGHTSGSISVIIHNRDAIVGDTLFNIFRKSVFPPFADDQEELLRSWGKLYDTGCQTFYPGHGNPFGIDKFRQSLETEKKRRAGR